MSKVNRSYTEEGGHRHQDEDISFTKEQLLAMDYIDGGEIRSHVHNGDGSIEYVACNNLLATVSRLCQDLLGNRMGAYFIVPHSFWLDCEQDWKEHQGKDPAFLPRTPHGGIMGMLADCTIYVDDTIADVYMRSDYNGVCWRFKVGDKHELVRRAQARELLGPYRGFDDRVYYIPPALAPFWGWNGYTPANVLLEWAKDGDPQAKQTLRRLALDAPKHHMVQEAITGLRELGEPISDAMEERLARLGTGA